MRAARRGIPLRALAPNAVTTLALCSGLTGILFAVEGNFGMAAGAVIMAGVLDGLDGRIARLLKGESRFGAELDSLSDVIAFGVSPAIILYLWSLQYLGEAGQRFGWIFALGHAACCALRLARFNAQIDASQQPHKSAGFLTGIPAPTGAGLTMLPLYVSLIFKGTGPVADVARNGALVAPWMAFIAFLMISSVPTFSWSSLRLRRHIRFELLAGIALISGAMLSIPWVTLTAISIAYLIAMPFGIKSYARVRRQRVSERVTSAPDAGSATL
ncbi:CDP-alcohol phosphatidyltransferase family protein [Sphingomonas solaris]|uniref:Phosphatidylcholine/phosphatidylserine synthase n=1 Tax=Alterirhizorhabdus solaris TaxID=2529389 RepID=A0A558QU50_9SPHN|nr:phosphatidylcholine/phosphatidylserine synthase [Sphingomonas solaris]TVV70671.1 phosphatidylcholine/phosphatidylserine synthase [Sphingomonas solaris]